MNLQAQRDISHKLKVFQHASESGNVAFTCRYFGISGSVRIFVCEALIDFSTATLPGSDPTSATHGPCSDQS